VEWIRFVRHRWGQGEHQEARSSGFPGGQWLPGEWRDRVAAALSEGVFLRFAKFTVVNSLVDEAE
jgi:hypothetical protein